MPFQLTSGKSPPSIISWYARTLKVSRNREKCWEFNRLAKIHMMLKRPVLLSLQIFQEDVENTNLCELNFTRISACGLRYTRNRFGQCACSLALMPKEDYVRDTLICQDPRASRNHSIREWENYLKDNMKIADGMVPLEFRVRFK